MKFHYVVFCKDCCCSESLEKEKSNITLSLSLSHYQKLLDFLNLKVIINNVHETIINEPSSVEGLRNIFAIIECDINYLYQENFEILKYINSRKEKKNFLVRDLKTNEIYKKTLNFDQSGQKFLPIFLDMLNKIERYEEFYKNLHHNVSKNLFVEDKDRLFLSTIYAVENFEFYKSNIQFNLNDEKFLKKLSSHDPFDQEGKRNILVTLLPYDRNSKIDISILSLILYIRSFKDKNLEKNIFGICQKYNISYNHFVDYVNVFGNKGFFLSVKEACEKEMICVKDLKIFVLGVASFFEEFVNQKKIEQKNVEKIILKASLKSNHTDKIGEKVKIENATIVKIIKNISSFYTQKLICIVKIISNNYNIYSFVYDQEKFKNKYCFEVGDKISITGVVKDKKIENNIKETYLKNVRILKPKRHSSKKSTD